MFLFWWIIFVHFCSCRIEITVDSECSPQTGRSFKTFIKYQRLFRHSTSFPAWDLFLLWTTREKFMWRIHGNVNTLSGFTRSPRVRSCRLSLSFVLHVIGFHQSHTNAFDMKTTLDVLCAIHAATDESQTKQHTSKAQNDVCWFDATTTTTIDVCWFCRSRFKRFVFCYVFFCSGSNVCRNEWNGLSSWSLQICYVIYFFRRSKTIFQWMIYFTRSLFLSLFSGLYYGRTTRGKRIGFWKGKVNIRMFLMVNDGMLGVPRITILSII